VQHDLVIIDDLVKAANESAAALSNIKAMSYEASGWGEGVTAAFASGTSAANIDEFNATWERTVEQAKYSRAKWRFIPGKTVWELRCARKDGGKLLAKMWKRDIDNMYSHWYQWKLEGNDAVCQSGSYGAAQRAVRKAIREGFGS
jgi:hypothetical protein